MGTIHEIYGAVEPLVSGFVVAGIVIATLVVLRLLLRREPIASKLRLPGTLLWLYLFTVLLAVASKLYFPGAFDALRLLSLFALALAVILSISFATFDLFLGRYRQVHIPTILRDIAVVIVYAVTIVIVLGRNGHDLSGILTTSAVLTAIIGFALQDLLSNIISGIAIQIERPFKVGDWLMLDQFKEQQGRVLEMNWRSVKVLTLHHDIVIVPNKVMTGSAVINFTEPDSYHRRHFDIGLRYEAPPSRVKASLLRAVRDVEGVLARPAPFVHLRSYDDFAITYRVLFYVSRFAAREGIEDQVRTRTWYQLKRDGLSVPFPIRDINIHQVTAEDEIKAREQSTAQIADTLAKVPLFEPLSTKERRVLAEALHSEIYGEREEVIRRGDAGDSFYIIASGQVEVRIGEQTVATLGPDNYFGEMSLMTGEARSATVVTKSDCEFYVIDKAAFLKLVENNQRLVDEIGQRLETRRDALDKKRKAATDEVGLAQEAPGEQHESLAQRIRRFFNLK